MTAEPMAAVAGSMPCQHPGRAEIHRTAIIGPVTGEPHRVRIDLPAGNKVRDR